MKRFRCYDNGGATADCYTIITVSRPYYSFFSSQNPCHPQGVWSAQETNVPIDYENTKRFGKRIPFNKLPEIIQKTILVWLA